MHALTVRQARRLALARAGLLKPEWTGFPRSGAGAGARAAALEVIGRFGYLQLDTVSVAGARSHVIVLLSRLQGFDPASGESLLQPGAPLFEYWGHEASWIPLELYPAFEFRRQAFHRHPWWGDLVGRHPAVATDLLQRIRDAGPLRSADLEGRGGRGWWDLNVAKRVATALWSRGDLAVRERRHFQRTYDLTERVIPEALRLRPLPPEEGLERLLLKALEGHGWGSSGTLAATWRLTGLKPQVDAALARLAAKGVVAPCTLAHPVNRPTPGWIRPADRELALRLDRLRPRRHRGVLLSPFDPLLWDRGRVRRLFGFDQVLEIFKPAGQRRYGYFCLPVLAGDHLVARVDLKARRREGTLQVCALRFEATGTAIPAMPVDGEAVRTALERYARALGLAVVR